jgi:hypothetical protein
MPHFLSPLLEPAPPPLRLVNRTRGTVVATTLEHAFDGAARKRGLLGRYGLPPGHAIVIAPCNAVHTFGMRFAIDILFVARDGRVVKVRRRVPARRLAGAWRGFATVELVGGALEASGTEAGDSVAVTT